MSIGATSGKVSDLMLSQQLLAQLRGNQAQLQRVQLQVSSGNQISSPSDNPVLAGQILDLNGLINQSNQYKTNTASASSLLSTTDTALSNATDLLRQAQSLALSSASSTTSAAQQTANAQVLDSIIGQMQQLANQKYQGQYLFDGQAGQGDPFVSSNGGILYTGGSNPFAFRLDANLTMNVALDGGTVFGAQSQPVGGNTDLNPIADPSVPTRLADLGGATGAGVTPGVIQVADSIHSPVVIDLSKAATINDVTDLFATAAPTGTTIRLAADGQHFVVSSSLIGADLTITDANGGTMARDMGIQASNAGRTVAGQDFRPLVTRTTPIAFLNNGTGLDDHGITIANGSRTATLTFDPNGTVGDLLNTINNAGLGVKASIAADGRSLQLVNVQSGTTMQVTENGGTTATQLGLRTLQWAASLSGFNNGQGVGRAASGLPDLRISLHDGTSFDVSLSRCSTVGDVLGAINGAAGIAGHLTASISPTDGFELTDSSTDTGSPLSVQSLNGSTAAADLGLEQSTSDTVLVGPDVSGVQSESVFTHLLALRQAIASNDQAQITAQGQLVQTDLNNMVNLRGTVGAQAAQVNAQGTRIDDQQANNQALLSQISNVDMTQAVLQFQQLQSQLTASIATMGKLLSVHLLDYIK